MDYQIPASIAFFGLLEMEMVGCFEISSFSNVSDIETHKRAYLSTPKTIRSAGNPENSPFIYDW